MTLAEFLTSWVAIATSGFFSALFAFLFVFRYKQVLEWEAKCIWSRYDALCRRIRLFIAKRMKSNARFMAWLNKPQKHGKPDADWIEGQIKVFGDVWK